MIKNFDTRSNLRGLTMMCFILLISIILISVYINPAAADTSGNELLAGYKQVAYNDENGLPTSDANCIMQSSAGYIWIGSYGGLICYDGTEFRQIQSQNLTSTSINVVFEDSMKRFWIGTDDRGLFLYQNGDVIDYNKVNLLSSASVRAITESGGNVYVSTTVGLVIINSLGEMRLLNKDVVDYAEEVNSDFVLDATALGGVIWGVLNYNDGTVFALNQNNEVIYFKDETDFNGYMPNCIFALNDTTVCVGTTDEQLILIDTLTSTHTYLAASGAEVINDIYVDTFDRMWVCSDTGVGFYTNDAGIFSAFHKLDNAVHDNSIEMMTEDYEGNYWFASSRQGIMQFIKSKFDSLNTIIGDTNEVVNTTLMHNDVLYTGTDEGLYAYDQNYNPVSNSFTALLATARVRCLTSDSSGNVWAATYSGIFRFDGTNVLALTETEGLPSNKARVIQQLKYGVMSGNMMVGTSSGVAIIENGAVTKTYEEYNGAAINTVLSLAEISDGSIFVGSESSGMYKISNDAVTCYDSGAGFPSGAVLRITKDPADDALWISTGSDLTYFKEGVFTVLDNAANDSGSIFDIKFVPLFNSGIITDYTVWLLKATGIVTCSKTDLLTGDDLDLECFGKRDGLDSSITANSWNCLSESGDLYLSCNSGVNRINTLVITRNTTKPYIVVNSITVDGVKYEIKDNTVTIPSSSVRIEIEYALLSYTKAENKIDYMLVGADSNFVSISGDDVSTLTYMNLDGGSYTLKIKGQNADGYASYNTVSIIINKELTFLEKPLFHLLMAFLVIGFIVGVSIFSMKINTTKMLARQAEYKNITEQALKAIASTIDAKDKYTNGHSNRVADYSVKIARKLGMSEENIENLYYTALLHDIGKIGIPDNILNKPDKLTAEEYNFIKQHTVIGGDILHELTAVQGVYEGAKFHHEKYDGSGYNCGIIGTKIPLFARIIGVADAFDAMNSNRPYRKALEMDAILMELERCSGTQLDPNIAAVLILLINNGEIK